MVEGPKEDTKEEIKGFIKNYDLIQEDSRVEDLLDFSESIEAFKSRIDAIKKPAIVGLVGGFGTGKSTMLFQLEKQIKKDVCWINFDAWKYPERQGLWEGFVLDFAVQIGLREEALRKIDGKGTANQAIDAASKIADAADLVASGAGLVGKVISLFKSSPAKRVFQLQNILSEMIRQQEKHVVVVIEDIDRSHDAGVYFLETLKDFMRRLSAETDIVAIVPIGDEQHHSNMPSYLKCLDYTEYFKPKDVGLVNFVESIFDVELFEKNYTYPKSEKIACRGGNMRGQVTTFLEELLKQPLVTPRSLKNILRHADIVFRQQIKDGHEPDWRVTICLAAAKHIPRSEKQKVSPFDSFRENGNVSSNTLYAAFLFAMIRDVPSVRQPDQENKSMVPMYPPKDIKLVVREWSARHHSWPYRGYDHFNNPTNDFYLCDFYLDY